MYIKKYLNIIANEKFYLSLQHKDIKVMTALSFSEFRKNMASSFDRVDEGEFVFVTRGIKKSYAIIAMDDDDMTITSKMAAKIEKARKEHVEGKTLRFENASEAQKWMEEI